MKIEFIDKKPMVWVHSSKKFLELTDKLPSTAVYWKTVTHHVPKGFILKEHRSTKKYGNIILYHVHKVGGSKTFRGHHDIYIERV